MFDFIGYIWNAIEDAAIAALQIAVAIIHWAVIALWAAVTTVANGLIVVGSKILDGFQKAWTFVKATYEDVLKPAFQKLKQIYTNVTDWLKNTLGPVIDFLKEVRAYILCFYKTWIRPVLDAIEATRAVLKILEALHVEWAQAVDNFLGELEGKINQALAAVLTPLNKVIGIVNGVITGDLLFQRFPFLMTLKRDAGHVWGFWLRSALGKPLKPGTDYDRTRDYPSDAPGANGKELALFYRGEDNRMQGYVAELVPLWVKATNYPPDEVFDVSEPSG